MLIPLRAPSASGLDDGRTPLAMLIAFALLTACEGIAGVERPLQPAIVRTTVAPDVGNALGASFTARVQHADSVAVRYRLTAAASPGWETTPAVAVTGDAATVPVLGLLPEQGYELHVVAWGKGGTVEGEPRALTTG